MKVEFTNVEKEVSDSIGDENYLGTIISGDVYLDDEPFGYFHILWCRSTDKEINVVVHAITSETETMAVILEGVEGSDSLKVISTPTKYYDAEWCSFNNVVFENEYRDYTKTEKSVYVGNLVYSQLEDIFTTTYIHILEINDHVYVK